MAKDTTVRKTMGLDLSDKESTYVVLDREGRVEREGKVATTAGALEKRFGEGEQLVVALEVGTHSPWVSRVLEGLGHRVVVANPRQIPLITRSQRKTDRTDAETLARLARADEALLAPVQHRGQRAQEGRSLIQARAHVVGARTAMAERGGKNQKKRAIVAVARKLAVLLHHLWVTGEVYDPLRQGSEQPMAA